MNIHSFRPECKSNPPDSPTLSAPLTVAFVADKRSAILNAALGLFVDLGFHGTAVPRIASVAGVSVGTIYRYFENKEAIVNELFRHCKQQLGAHLLSDFPIASSASVQFMTAWRRMAEFIRVNPEAYAFVEAHDHQPYLDQASREGAAQLFATAVGYIQAAQARGEVRVGDPAMLWALVEGSFIGLARFARDGRLDLTPEVVEASGHAAWCLIEPSAPAHDDGPQAG